MNTYLVRVEDESVYDLLSFYGTITWKSTVINICAIDTKYPMNYITKIKGVIQVEKNRTGTFYRV